MNILYLVFGEEQRNHTQAYFSICSFLSQMSTSDRIYILTDAPRYYQRVSARVNIVEISKGLLEEWEGEYSFFWRVKIKAIEYICSIHPDEDVLYLDTDTFLYADIRQLKASLKHPLMHLNEGKLSTLKSKTERLMWRQVGKKSFGGVVIHSEHCMWNAGVVALPAPIGMNIVKMALIICDNMLLAKVSRRLIEQFAISVAMSEFGEIKPASSSIGHYWANKFEWNEVIQRFLADSFLSSRSFEQDIEVVSKWDFAKIPIQKRIPNTQIRLKKIIEKLFPTEDIQRVKTR
ncbi:hypothetical protein VB264_11740 [Arcicella aquatica]|uniref:Nucleotide-diphospho-sugar transferase domain-containing protein n=1 Tax=Arcicella aquatica TaxID=217141 RepID=A0ABU5QPX7_9BACT|nr:hypothetical protein [Arcicella aquatica]MEA5258456.1 hypothetical protein [Arcicella aquatica]